MVAILVVATIITCVVIDLIVQARQKSVLMATSAGTALAGDSTLMSSQANPRKRFRESDYLIPMGVFFHKGHTWAHLLLSGHVKVGMDDFARRNIGKVDVVSLPDIGKEVRQGEKLFTIKQGTKEAVFRSPVDGTIVGYNKKLAENPDVLKSDPYIEGWVCVVKPHDLIGNLKNLKIAKDAAVWFREEIVRFKDMLVGRTLQLAEVGQTIQDGGEMMEGVLEVLDESMWKNFNREFLS